MTSFKSPDHLQVKQSYGAAGLSPAKTKKFRHKFTEGFVLVFARKTKEWELKIDGHILHAVPLAPDGFESKYYDPSYKLQDKDDMLKKIRDANLIYEIAESHDELKKWIYVIITAPRGIY